MIRENRYIVFKKTDVEKYLGQKQQEQLQHLGYVVSMKRSMELKQPLQCVVVENDWPEYEQVWKMIEDRVDGISDGFLTPVELYSDFCNGCTKHELYDPDEYPNERTPHNCVAWLCNNGSCPHDKEIGTIMDQLVSSQDRKSFKKAPDNV